MRERCNGHQECRDSSDEVCGCEDYCTGEAEHRCVDNTCLMLSADPRCDGEFQCPDGSDEFSCPQAVCPPGQWRCYTGLCIPASLLCDGVPQCPDLSDEVECSGSVDIGVRDCEADQFRCDTGQCVEAGAVCDGVNQCRDGSDETLCKNILGDKMSSWRKLST